ncbi:phospholipid-transporting ATPase Dnf1p [Diutina catenulata]
MRLGHQRERQAPSDEEEASSVYSDDAKEPVYGTGDEFSQPPPSFKARMQRYFYRKGWASRPFYMQTVYDHTPRRIWVNQPLPADAVDDRGLPLAKFPPNKIRTTKYTPLSFLPKNIVLQFTNVANFYFLVLIILGAFTIFGVDSPGLAAVPLIVIVCITAAKDAFEDYRRASSDSELNNSPVHLVVGLDNANVVHLPPTALQKFNSALGSVFAGMWRGIKRAFIAVFFTKAAKQKLHDQEVADHDLALRRVSTVESRVSPRASYERKDANQPGSFQPGYDQNRPGYDQNRPSYERKASSPLPHYETATDALNQPANRGSVLSPRHSVYSPRRSLQSAASRLHPTQIVPHTIISPELVRDNGDAGNVSKFKNRRWKDIEVGSFVRIRANEEMPADLILLSSSDPEGGCSVETKNLDGETNLKPRQSVACGGTSVIKRPTDLGNTRFWVECDAPNSHLYEFKGTIHYEDWDEQGTLVNPDAKESVTNDNILLRGTTLRQTDWVIGLVVYTGAETKIMLNSGITPTKKSRISRELNLSVILNFVLLFVLCFVSGLVNGLFYNKRDESRLYFEYEPYAPTSAANGVVAFFVALIIYQALVPISLYISVEIIKTCQAYFIHSDIKMYYERLDFPCVPKSWSISDDLGQIEYIFSDKTGTLTQNVMQFKKCTIAGKSYGLAYTEAQQGMDRRAGVDIVAETERWSRLIAKDREVMVSRLQVLSDNPQFDEHDLTFVSSAYVDDVLEGTPERRNANEQFMLALAVCNTISAQEDESGRLVYDAESPDEAALVSVARDVGIVFRRRERKVLTLDLYGQRTQYELLQVIAFTSARKRMSCIVRTPDNRIIMICKGADNVIYQRLAATENSADLVRTTAQHLEEFATEGLRTLCIAERELDPEYYAEWAVRFKEAHASIAQDRDEGIEVVADEIERDLTLLGGTAIEDCLQQGVPDSIAILGQAGIKMWVLTGDRVETAINIGFSCNLLENDMTLLVIRPDSAATLDDIEKVLDGYLIQHFGIEPHGDDEVGQLIAEARADHSVPSARFGLVIDGAALGLVFPPAKTKKVDPRVQAVQQKLLLLGKQCKSVLCCRVSPSQKAAVVVAVKEQLEVMTLAIGDGANDVAMIQAANVGVGIAGEEGRQAVMSSDYAIGQFRFLTRLLLVHGRWSYKRLAEMVPCFFYKNVVFTLTLFWFQIYNNFDGSYLYEYTYLMFYNLAFTSLPVIFLAIFDQDVSDTVSLLVPQLFRSGILRQDWSQYKFLWYMLDGVYQSVISFYFPYLIFYKSFINMDGRVMDHRFWIGVTCAIITVTVCNIYMLLQQQRWDWLSLLIDAISVLLVFFWTGVWSERVIIGEFYNAATQTLGNLSVWAVFFVSIIACILPRFTFDFLRRNFRPTDSDIIREQVKQGQFDAYPRGFDPTDIEDIERRHIVTNLYENHPEKLRELEAEIETKYPPRQHHHTVTRAMSTLKRKTSASVRRPRDSSGGSLKKNLNLQFHRPLAMNELRGQMGENELAPVYSLSRVQTTHELPGLPQADTLMKYHSATSRQQVV